MPPLSWAKTFQKKRIICRFKNYFYYWSTGRSPCFMLALVNRVDDNFCIQIKYRLKLKVKIHMTYLYKISFLVPANHTCNLKSEMMCGVVRGGSECFSTPSSLMFCGLFKINQCLCQRIVLLYDSVHVFCGICRGCRWCTVTIFCLSLLR